MSGRAAVKSRKAPVNKRGASARQQPGPRRDWRATANKASRVLLTVTVLALAGWGGKALFDTLHAQQVETIRIARPLEQVADGEIKRMVAGFTTDSLIELDLAQVKVVLEEHPWIKNAEVRREWPDTMIIDVTEQVPIARWRGDRLLNANGRIFQPENLPGRSQLPDLAGPQGSEAEVMEQYQRFNQLLYPLGLKVAALELNARGSWRLELDNGVAVQVGTEQIMARMRRLVSFLETALPDQLAAFESIDLRYSNGISVSRRNLLSELPALQ